MQTWFFTDEDDKQYQDRTSKYIKTQSFRFLTICSTVSWRNNLIIRFFHVRFVCVFFQMATWSTPTVPTAICDATYAAKCPPSLTPSWRAERSKWRTGFNKTAYIAYDWWNYVGSCLEFASSMAWCACRITMAAWLHINAILLCSVRNAFRRAAGLLVGQTGHADRKCDPVHEIACRHLRRTRSSGTRQARARKIHVYCMCCSCGSLVRSGFYNRLSQQCI